MLERFNDDILVIMWIHQWEGLQWMRFETKLLIDPHTCWINFKQRTKKKGSYVVFPYLLSCFKFPNGNVESAESPCNWNTYKTGRWGTTSHFFVVCCFLLIEISFTVLKRFALCTFHCDHCHDFNHHLSFRCQHYSEQPLGVPGGGQAMQESSQLPSQPDYQILITSDNLLMTMLNLLLSDTLKELQHR